MVKRFLVTTALEETACKDKPVLFLGEWCHKVSKHSDTSNIDSETLSYHWDDRNKLHSDYLYVMGLYENLLKDLANQLIGEIF